ncbi:hypothetical protein Dimus_005152 [Dionaea muscipula]
MQLPVMDHTLRFLLLFIFFPWFSAMFLLYFLRHKSIKGKTRVVKNLPPGPYFLTNIRNLFSLVNQPHKYFAQLAMVYGPLMSIRLGSMTTVVISSAYMAREVLQKNDASFSYRKVVLSFSVLHHDEATVAFFPPNASWRNLRRIFKSLIFSGSKLESSKGIRRQKVRQLLGYVQGHCESGGVVNIGEAAFTASLNFLSNIVFSVDLADHPGGEFWELVWTIGKVIGKPNVADYIPMLRVIDPQGICRRTKALVHKAIRILDGLINSRLESSNCKETSKENDMLDALLTLCQQEDNELQLSHLPHIILELFVGGTDTTSSTIEWAMAELLRSPEKLAKAKAELEEVIGKGNDPVEEDDIVRLPYLQAVVKETHRMHPSVPFLVPRTVMIDVDLCGYTVPKNAQVLVNVWAIGRDDSIWENANAFMPERFLGSQIDVKGHDFELLPFGAGRRICVGMPVAHRMIHSVLGSLIHSFDWTLEESMGPPISMDMDDTFGFTLRKAQALRTIPTTRA